MGLYAGERRKWGRGDCEEKGFERRSQDGVGGENKSSNPSGMNRVSPWF